MSPGKLTMRDAWIDWYLTRGDTAAAKVLLGLGHRPMGFITSKETTAAGPMTEEDFFASAKNAYRRSGRR